MPSKRFRAQGNGFNPNLMNVRYYLTVLPPKLPKAEALSQEISALRQHFSGDLIYLNPNQHSPIYVPRLLFGFQRLMALRRQESALSLHHFYNPDPFPFPVLSWLKKPVIYTITSGVGQKRPNLAYFSKLAAIAVADERSKQQLHAWGLENAVQVRPGIDTRQFHYSAPPTTSPLTLMVGSAPWTTAQFQTKGVDALLEIAQQNPDLHLIFLWRGVLADEMKQRIQSCNVTKQVTLIDQLVDVNEVLGRVHACINLATAAGIVKSYPHSLLDSLAAGKPVLVSQAIPMADYVTRTGCGSVVKAVTAAAIQEAISDLMSRYDEAQQIAQVVGQTDFSQQRMISSYKALYQKVLENA
ncbi:MAG: glycosyltransferase [Chloroflexota bacterium]